MTVGEMLDRMSSRELSEWLAYDRIEPLSDPWQQTGQICMLLAGFLGEKTKVTDWIPSHKPPKPVSPEATRRYLEHIFGKPDQ